MSRLMELYTLFSRLHGLLAAALVTALGALMRWQAKIPLRLRLSTGFLVLAGISLWTGARAVPHYWEWTGYLEEHLDRLREGGLTGLGDRVAWLGWISAGICLLTAGTVWLRHPLVFGLQKAAVAAYGVMWLSWHLFVTRVPAYLNAVDVKGFPNALRNEYWLRAWGPWLPALLPVLLVTLGVVRRSTRGAFTREKVSTPLAGDRVYENLRTGGRDPRMRSSTYWSAFLFFMVLVGPFLMRGCGWEDPYGLIKGSGDPVVEMVQVTRREIPQQRMIVNNWSPYIFERMKLDDIQVMEELDELTQNTYEIAQETSGKLGEGGGDTGGWPDGMEGATVRFIRLQYSGGDWDQNMDRNSDANLLRRMHQITGFPVASDGEGLGINRLRRFPEARKPPFVFMTGRGNIRMSQQEVNTLRWYTLEEGGMIFATHGGGNFGRNFRRELGRIFPGYRLVDIPNDDPIFRAPFLFPGGAPPLWQQDGSRALGIRHEGRWVVFYHPGDMSDAWRDGHSGARPEVAEQAYRMAINVMYYAFNMYHARHN